MIKFLKQFGIALLIISALTAVSLAVNAILDASYLTNMFVIIRKFTMVLNYFWNIPVLFSFVSIILTIEITLWLYKAYVFIATYFGKHDD